LKVNRLLAGTLAFVLITGLGTPAFADFGLEGTGPGTSPEQPLAPQVVPPNVIYDNGLPNLINAANVGNFVSASDFVIADDTTLTDVHLWMCERTNQVWDGTIEWWIFEDAAGSPGTIFAEGDGVLIDKILTVDTFLDCTLSELWFDLDNSVELEGGTTYWLGLHLEGNFVSDIVLWATADPNGSLPLHASSGGTFDNWIVPGGVFEEVAFFLTGHSKIVGGEFLPIDSTALMLAGLQSSAIWMLPILAGAAGAGAYYIKTRMNKDN